MRLYHVIATKGQWDDHWQFTVGIATSPESAQAIKEQYEKRYHEYISRYTPEQREQFENDFKGTLEYRGDYFEWKFSPYSYCDHNNDAEICEIESDNLLIPQNAPNENIYNK